MRIFDVLENDNFFKPFSSKNKEIYLDCMMRIIEKSKQSTIMYDSEVKDIIDIYLNNSKILYIDEKDEAGQSICEKNSADITRYYRDCGWLTEKVIGRNGEYETNVTLYCRRIIDFFNNLVSKSSEGALSNKIINMSDILKSAIAGDSVRSERPYSNMLKPLIDSMDDLSNELLDLKESISKIMKKATEFKDLNSISNFMLKSEILEKFFNDYFFIKNDGKIPVIIGNIRENLRKIRTDEWITRIAKNYYEQHPEVNEFEARATINSNIQRLSNFVLYDYQEYMDSIERQINNYYELASAKMAMFSKNGINLEGALDNLLQEISNSKDDLITNKISECILIQSQKYISTKSFEKNKKRDLSASKAYISSCLFIYNFRMLQ